jgi:uncharacterized damage-inducible protein DinB
MTHGTPTTPDGLAPTPSAATQFLDAYTREHATTEKVLRAYPSDQSELRPHERSSSARQLAWTFVGEEAMMLRAARHEQVLTGERFPPPPDSWDEIVDRFAAQHGELLAILRGATDASMAGTVQFFTGPRQLGEYPTLEFLWFMLCDQIHHRGQLSVYLRMAGGKVPSIYGPSADEPWS